MSEFDHFSFFDYVYHDPRSWFTSPFILGAGCPNGGTIYTMDIGRCYRPELGLLFYWASELNGMETVSNSEDWKQKCIEASVEIERRFGLMIGW